MYYVSKTLEISGSHCLDLNYESKCKNVHGHNWIITVHCKSEELNENGMVIDFSTIKGIIHDLLDHQHLNNVLDFNTTAENLAKWITDMVPCCYKATVQESKGNIATFEYGGK